MVAKKKQMARPRPKRAAAKKVDEAQLREAVRGYLNTGKDVAGILSTKEKAKLDVARAKAPQGLFYQILNWFRV